MKTYLDAYRQILPPFERVALDAHLAAFGPAVGRTEEEQRAMVQELLAALEQDRRVFLTPRLMQGQLSSRDYNANWQEILTDLHTLYRRTKQIEAILANHQAIARAAIARLDREIKALQARIEALAVANDRFGGFQAAWCERFETPRIEQELRRSWYFDPLGKISPSNFVARIDPIGQALTLAVRHQVDVTRDAEGRVTGTLEIVEMSGEAFRDPDPRFGPQNALDGDPESVWAEVILSDGVFQVPYSDVYVDGKTGQELEQVLVDRGAWVRLRLELGSNVPVNGLYLLPYGEYPMDLVQVRAEGWTNAIFRGPIPLTHATFVALPSISTKALEILLAQRHAVHHVYTVTEQALRQRDFWRAAVGLHRELTAASWWLKQDAEARSAVLQRRLEQLDVAWQQYLQATLAYAESLAQGHDPLTSAAEAIETVAALDKPKRVQVERYEYVLGLRELAARYTEYEEAACYVSPAIALPANAVEVMLEVEEEHPSLPEWGLRKQAITDDTDDGNHEVEFVPVDDSLPDRHTSVEYWIAPTENPGEDDWIPILPANVTEVLDERLQFSEVPGNNAEHVARLRFPADPDRPIRLYEDHDPVDPGRYQIDLDAQGQTRIITLQDYNPQKIYTVDYTPDRNANPHRIELLKVWRTPEGTLRTQSHTVHFRGADRHFCVQLPHVPWVDRERLSDLSYNPVRVTLNHPVAPGRNPDIHRIQIGEEATTEPIVSTRDPAWKPPVGTPQARLLNCTRYADEDLPVLDPYDPMAELPTFQYFHVANKVYFTEDFRSDGPEANYGVSHGNAIITVEYETFVTHLRVKAILRRNDALETGISPRVRKLVVKVRSV